MWASVIRADPILTRAGYLNSNVRRRLGSIRRSRRLHYVLAVLAAGAAALIRLSLTSFLADRNQLVMFYPAIMFSAWLGGLWPGIVATMVSALLDGYLFLEPLFTLRLTHHGDKVALGIFVATGIVISVLNENLRRVALSEQSARKEAERARRDADTANRTKDFFLAAVSHDLRAPMNATLGWADMLRKHALDEAQRAHAIDAIQRAMSHQLLLVNDLLDSAAILSGKLRVAQGVVVLESVVRAAVDTVAPLVASKRLHLTVKCAIERQTVMGDAARLQQIVSNLLTNAIKFTPERGSVDVRVQQAGSQVEVRVKDTGKGIPPGDLPFVFERFWQGDGSGTRPNKGVGLGLSIAKHLVRAHGGTIDVASLGDGQGATFTVRLPLAATPAQGNDVSSLAKLG